MEFFSGLLKMAADGLRQSSWPSKGEWHETDAAVADFMIGPAYMMLMGFAVEDTLKAMIIAREPEIVEEEELPKSICTHDLGKLWERVGLPRCSEYNRLLTRLHTFIVSFGRYPVSRLKRDMDTVLDAHFYGESDFPGMERLWAFLQKKLSELCPEIPLENEASPANH